MEFTEETAGQSKEMPAKIVIYAEPKTGKTTFASEAPDPFFINIEGGLNYLDKKVRTTPRLKSYDDVIAWLSHIYKTDTFTAGTIVIDSLDWLEALAQEKLIKQESATSITDPKVKAFAYNKGVADAAELAVRALKWLDAIYEKKGIPAIIIAHSQIKNIDLPNKDPFSRFDLKLSKQLAARVSEWADLILFAGKTFHVTKDGKAAGEPRRVIYASNSASFVGGGRMRLDKELPLSYSELRKEITQ